MKNLKIRKELVKLAMINTFILAGLSNERVYANDNEIIDITEFDSIKDIVIAKENEVAIMSSPSTSSNLVGVLKPNDYLKLVADAENYYEVLYRGNLAYVKCNNVEVSTIDDLNEMNRSLYNTVVAKTYSDLKKQPSEESETVGFLREKESLIVLGKKDGYYEVKYKNDIAYVLDSAVEYKEAFIKSGYIKEDTSIYDSIELNNKVSEISKQEFVRIYNEEDNCYYIDNGDTTGYINKDDVELLTEMYIITDISDQITELYCNNELLLSSAVVTGEPPKNSTPTGVYYIGDKKGEITDHRYLVGPGYQSYVDYMMKFTGNIGFHDSERGIDDRGKSHGWRDYLEYGGDTYLTDGSHGCVNMPNTAAETMYNIVYPYVVEKGNLVKVLVKE